MDLGELRKIVKARIDNDKIRQRLRDEVIKYKDSTQKFDTLQENTFKPITKVQEETKSLIDKKQDEVIQELRDNQLALMDSVGALALPNPQQPTRALEDKTKTKEPEPEKKSKVVRTNAERELEPNDLHVLEVNGYPRPNVVTMEVMDGTRSTDSLKKLIADVGEFNKREGPRTKMYEKYLYKRKNKESTESMASTEKESGSLNKKEITYLIEGRRT